MTISVLIRISFLYLVSLPFFVTEDNVIYSFGILGAFVLSAAILLITYYKPLLKEPSLS